VIGSIIYISTYHLELSYPMDSSFFLAAGACVCTLLYLCSLLVSVQFRGDFGVVADETPTSADMASSLNLGHAKPIAAYTALQRRVGSTANLRGVSNNIAPYTQSHVQASLQTPLTTPRSTYSSSTPARDPRGHAYVSAHGGDEASRCSCTDLLEIPRGDLRLLLSSPVAGYGTKLHNLKLGMKDS